MNIYFHIDELNRDAIVASALKKKFADQGHRLIYGNRVTNRLLNYFHKAFDVIVVPRPQFLYNNWGDAWMNWDVRFVTLSTESLGIICQDHQVMAKTLLERDYFEGNRQYIDRIDAFCFWGSKQRQAIKDFASDVVHKCHVVGHPRHDTICVGPGRLPEPQSVSKTIGIIIRSAALNDYFGRSPLESYSMLFDEFFQYEFINQVSGEKLRSRRAGIKPADILIIQAMDVENTLKVMKALLDKGYKVAVRVHPRENTDVWRTLLTRCHLDVELSDPGQPISTWLKGKDYIVGPPSTSFYDALMLGVTPISICELDARRQQYIGELWEENNRLMPHVFKPKSINALIEYIDTGARITPADELLGILNEEANFPACRDALDKVVAICTENQRSIKNKSLFLLGFRCLKTLYFTAWRIKNRVIGRRENSAMFAMGKKTSRFIDNLTSVQ